MTNIDDLSAYFKDKALLSLALTHKSWVNEHPEENESNERLEFLGDAVLEFVISKELYAKFPGKEEGYLTALRASLVNTINLADIAQKAQVGKHLKLSKGEEEGGGRENPSILANAVEAIIGALYIDGGIANAEEFIKLNLLTKIEEKINQPLKDAKSRLQEHVQSQGFSSPKYQVIEEAGPDHAKKFTIEVLIEGKPIGRGVGKNKGEAEQEAAKKALENFK